MNLVMTWSAGNEGDQNRPQVKKSKSPWGKFLELGISEKEKGKGKKDTKGRGLAIESSSAQAETSTKGRRLKSTQWTNEEIEDLLRYKYTHKMMGLSKGRKEGRDWKKITAVWSAKHGDIELKSLNDYAARLTHKMNEIANKFDALHPEERNFGWTDELNEDLIRTYYLTEEGDISEHGERMLAEWMRSHSTYYWNVRGEYLLNRAKAMLHGVLKVTPSDLKSEESVYVIPRKHLLLKKDHEDFLEELWEKYPLNTNFRREKIFNDTVAKFGELETVGKSRLSQHAKYLYHRNKRFRTIKGFKPEKIEERRSRESIRKIPFIWRTEHDETLPRFWKEEKEKGQSTDRLERFYERVLGRFPDLDSLTPLQVYRRVKHVNYKSKVKQAEAAGQEIMQETHVPYHHFIDQQSMPLMSQRTYHHHEWMASTSSHPGPSHQEPDLTLGLDTLHFERQSPNTDSDQD